MVHWIKPAIRRRYLILVLALLLAGYGAVARTTVMVQHPAFQDQIRAAELMQVALGVARTQRLVRGIPINRELDPNETGLIGERYTLITTSLGNLEAKRTSVSPAFAALMVRLFYQADLQPGAVVAIGASGSFPGLIVATLAACHTLRLRPVLIYSVGASMYGANIPEFSFAQMLEAWRDAGLLPYTILAASLGGDNDRGEGLLYSAAQETMRDLAIATGGTLIFERDNAASIQKRLALYAEQSPYGRPDCFVNIGGATPNHGNTSASLKFPSGLVTELKTRGMGAERGLIFEYLEQRIPVIHLLNIRDLALKSGISIDPAPFPTPGTEAVYFELQSRPGFIWVTVLLAWVILIFGRILKGGWSCPAN